VLCGCGSRHPIALHPLLLVTGASGTGKTTIGLQLAGAFREAVVLDQDILWMPEMDTPEDNSRRFHSLWLRLAVNIGQSGRPLLLVGSTDPDQYERLPERRYISSIHTLALVCEDKELRHRLTSRPEWRGSGGNRFVGSMLEFNRSLRALAQGQADRVTLLDTTHDPPNISAARVATWARKILEEATGGRTGYGPVGRQSRARGRRAGRDGEVLCGSGGSSIRAAPGRVPGGVSDGGAAIEDQALDLGWASGMGLAPKGTYCRGQAPAKRRETVTEEPGNAEDASRDYKAIHDTDWIDRAR